MSTTRKIEENLAAIKMVFYKFKRRTNERLKEEERKRDLGRGLVQSGKSFTRPISRIPSLTQRRSSDIANVVIARRKELGQTQGCRVTLKFHQNNYVMFFELSKNYVIIA